MAIKSKIKITMATLLLVISLFFAPVQAKLQTKCVEPEVKLVELVAEPKKYLNKKIYISGTFFSFSNLSLDYSRAMKTSKDYIGIILARPDHKDIPLVELKLSAPLKLFKDTNLSFEHGDKIAMKAKVYAIALGEPWLEVEAIDVIEKVNAGN